MINFDFEIKEVIVGRLKASAVLSWLKDIDCGRIITNKDKKFFLKHIQETRYGGNSRDFSVTCGKDNEKNYNDLIYNRLIEGQLELDAVVAFICEKENIKLKHIQVFKYEPDILDLEELQSQNESVWNKERVSIQTPSVETLTGIYFTDEVLRFKVIYPAIENHLKRGEIKVFAGKFYSPWEEIKTRKVLIVDVLPDLNRILLRSEPPIDQNGVKLIRQIFEGILEKCGIAKYRPCNFMESVDELVEAEIIESDLIRTSKDDLLLELKSATGQNVFDDETYQTINEGDGDYENLPMSYLRGKWNLEATNLGDKEEIVTYIDTINGQIKFRHFPEKPNGALNEILQHLDGAFS